MHPTHNPSSITHHLAEKHTFSSKERDAETGLSYFGARYYSSELSIWLSVDPMSGKYPSLSPYVYCADNPVKFTDPDGNWIPGLDEDGNVTYTADSVDLSRFIADIPLSISFKPKSGKILLPKNKYIPIHFFEIDFSTLGNRQTLRYWSEGGGRFFTDSKDCNYYSYKYLSAKNPKARSKMTGLLLSIPASYSKEFEKRY